MSRWLAALAAIGLALCSAGARAADAREQALVDSQAAIGRSLADAGVDTLPLVDALRRPLRLADLQGKPLVVSFVYTGCFESCPVTTQRLVKAVDEARDALGKDAFNVVTIGFNSPFDDPTAMGALARQARADGDTRWAFASGSPEDVKALTRAFGFSYAATPAGFDHIAQLSVVDSRGVIFRQVYGEDFELTHFVGPLKELINGEVSDTLSLDAVWTKVKLYCTVYDPSSGRYKFNYSIFVELFAGSTVLLSILWFVVREARRRREPQ